MRLMPALFILVLVLGVGGRIQAQPLEFPKTEEEIVKALQPQAAPSPARTRGLSGRTRGIAKVAEAPPKVAALVLFDYDSAAIRPESLPLVDEFGKALRGGLSNATILVIGHTDDVGDEAYNERLSLRRAEAVKDCLVKRHTVDPGRIQVGGMGEAQPVADNGTEQGRAMNRRVEFERIGGQ